jgi:hypothetical protein
MCTEIPIIDVSALLNDDDINNEAALKVGGEQSQMFENQQFQSFPRSHFIPKEIHPNFIFVLYSYSHSHLI